MAEQCTRLPSWDCGRCVRACLQQQKRNHGVGLPLAVVLQEGAQGASEQPVLCRGEGGRSELAHLAGAAWGTLTLDTFDLGGPAWPQGNVVVIEGDGELQERQAPHLVPVLR